MQEMFLEKFTEDVYANAKHKKSVAYKNLCKFFLLGGHAEN